MSIVDFCKCFWKNRIFVSFFSEYQTWNLIKRGTQMSSKCLIVNFNTYSNNTLVLPVLCFVALISIANAAETTWSTEHHDLSYRLSGFYGHTIIRGGGPWMMVWCGLCWVTGDFWSLSLRGPEQQARSSAPRSRLARSDTMEAERFRWRGWLPKFLLIQENEINMLRLFSLRPRCTRSRLGSEVHSSKV